jgi:hypothetical protein
MHQALGMLPYHLLDICHTTLDQVRLRYLLARYLYHLGGPFNRVNELSPPTVARLREAYEALHTRNSIVQQTLTDIETSKARWDEINGNLATALSGIIDGPFATLFDGDDALTWEQIDRERMIVVLQTHSLSTREMGRKIGKLFLQDFQGYIGHRYASGELAGRAPIHLIIDEMGEMIYDDFTGAINKIGEASARLFMGWQTEADLDSEIGIQRAKVVRANVKTRLFLRIDDAETAQHISRYCGTCNIPQRQSESMSHTYASNQSASSQARINVVEQEVPLIQPSWLASLPQGECFARIQGQLYKLAIPLLEDDLSCDS